MTGSMNRGSITVHRARDLVQRFVRDETGATAIEYSLMLMMISVACIASFKAVGGSTSNGWGGVANKVGNAMK